MVQTYPGLGGVVVFDEDWEGGDVRVIRGVRNISRSDSEFARALAIPCVDNLGVAKFSRSVSEEGRDFKALDLVTTIVASTQAAS